MLKYPFLAAIAFFVLGHAAPVFCLESTAGKAQGRLVEFSQFSAVLPSGWDGDEQTGFISDDPNEYMLTLSRKDQSEDHVEAQVSIFLLPNKPGKDARESALALAEAQGDASEPAQKDNFWIFTGEPRSRAVKGMATTMVNATPELLLIIIAQDPLRGEADEIVRSLAGLSANGRLLLGR